jgi:hypothetical protein
LSCVGSGAEEGGQVWQRRLAFVQKIFRREKRATLSSPMRRQAAEAEGIASTA